MPLVETRRGAIFCAIHGRRADAPKALLIHGAGGSHLSFPAAWRRLTSIGAILPNLPGHGSSPGQGRDSIKEYALDMLAMLDALGIESAVIIGHSMGGAIAQQIAIEDSQRALALVLVCTGGRLPVNPALIAGIASDTESTLENLSRWMWPRDAPAAAIAATKAIMRETPPTVFQRDLSACSRFDLVSQLPDIIAPALVLAGEKDKMTPVALSREVHAGIAGSHLRILPGSGHMLQLEQPAETARIIDAWLANLNL